MHQHLETENSTTAAAVVMYRSVHYELYFPNSEEILFLRATCWLVMTYIPHHSPLPIETMFHIPNLLTFHPTSTILNHHCFIAPQSQHPRLVSSLHIYLSLHFRCLSQLIAIRLCRHYPCRLQSPLPVRSSPDDVFEPTVFDNQLPPSTTREPCAYTSNC